jgi:hypothetical protein
MNNQLAKYISIFLTVLGLAVGAIWYMSNAHAEIKNWTLEQDSVRTEQVVENIEKHYVPKEDFIELKTDIKHIKKTLDKMERKLDSQ